MKKKLALLLAGVMVAAMVPVTAFASSQNRLTDNVKTVVKDTATTSTIAIRDDKGDLTAFNNPTDGADIVFELTLGNAKWDSNIVVSAGPPAVTSEITFGGAQLVDVAASFVINSETSATVTIPKAVATTSGFLAANDELLINFGTKLKDDGEATITINPVAGGVSSGTFTYAIAASGSTITTIEGTTTFSEAAVAAKAISIVEAAPGSFKAGDITLRLSKNFKFTNGTGNVITVTRSYGDVAFTSPVAAGNYDDNEITIPVTAAGNTVSKLVITGLDIQGTSKVKDGDVAEITISGGGVTKHTLEVGTFAEYGYTFTVEDKDLPVLYSGSYDDNDTLKVTFKEPVANSWSANRKTTFTFPKGIKVVNVDVKKVTNVTDGAAVPTAYTTGTLSTLLTNGIDENKVSVSGIATSGKAEIQMVFELSVAPDFTGDITCTAGGSALGEDTEVIVATAEAPFTVEVNTAEVNIDYRNVKVNDIVIKENYDGALASGTVLTLDAELLTFEKGFKWEVTEGDLDVRDITVNRNGTIEIDIKSESAKTPGTIVISDLSLFLDRSLPAGNYGLSVIPTGNGAVVASSATIAATVLAMDTANANEAFFKNYVANDVDPGFDVDEVVVADAFVKVITAGRDQDDSTFTTQISVPIGAYEIKAGTKTVALDTPAYINEAGYTMMPLRGVVEALSGSAIISWDDASKTVTILFGTRVISMTIGVKSMIINGTAIAMTSAPVIVNSRTFLPLRDLGYALGLGESKINWDDTTKTATLN